MEYFSAECGRMMKYNPVTGETCGIDEPSQNHSGTLPGGISTPDLNRVGELAETSTSRCNVRCCGFRSQGREANVSSVSIENKGRAEPPLDDDRPNHGNLPHSYKTTSITPPSLPSSLSASHTTSRTPVPPRSLPNRFGDVDDKVVPSRVLSPPCVLHL